MSQAGFEPGTCAWWGHAEEAAPKRKLPVFLERASPVTAAKALKNEAELAGMREAHLRDSVALVQTLMWVEQEVMSPSNPI